MQCSNCQFENLPGVLACGRCGALLPVAPMPADECPAVDNPAAKRRRWFSGAWWWGRLRGAASYLLAFRVPTWASNQPAVPLVLRMVVPGWPQWYSGRAAHGKWMFWLYVGLLLAGLLFLGTPLGSLLLGLALSVHAASVLDIMVATDLDYRTRLVYAFVSMIVLGAVVYYPLGWLLARVAVPHRFAAAAPPFEEGDVVLVNPSAYLWSDPQPGDVVLYEVATQTVEQPGRAGAAATYYLEGDRIDRVIAQAGQKVTCTGEQLSVDGEASRWLPLNPAGLPEQLEMVVPEHCYLVLPTTDSLSWKYPPEVWRALSIVSREQVRGRVYLRYQPLWRFARIR
jgi:hypothetical protein